ncbi:MAG: ATP-binding cassette domain-containing protein [Myxococcota bacterium]|nr:ATP-binding cassette domain-containing protein [Myxococcota bacterium]
MSEPAQPLLALESLRVGYGRGFSVGPFDQAWGPGLIQVIGPNGCGKTTVFRAICGELRPLSGRCKVLGQDSWRYPEIRREIGYLAARPELPGFLGVAESWRFAALMRGRPHWDGEPLCAQLGLSGSMRLSQGSQGQRRAAELLSALAGEPSVLLLDEPFTGLDDERVALLAQWLEDWRASRLVLLTGHAQGAKAHRLPLLRPPDAEWVLG